MSHQEENQTLTHIQPMQYIPKPLHVLTHPVEKYIEWLTCDLSEQHKKLEPPQIRKKGKKIKN